MCVCVCVIVSEVTVFHRALQCVVDMVTATHELEDACNAHDPNHNLNSMLVCVCVC